MEHTFDESGSVSLIGESFLINGDLSFFNKSYTLSNYLQFTDLEYTGSLTCSKAGMHVFYQGKD